jgi:lipoprotein-anchoring transpeptidase ErfK/SrfK
VSLTDKKVVVQDPKGETIKEYPIYIGTSASPTPRGEFRIMENVSPGPDEWYYDHHWLGFQRSEGRYTGFHGWVYTPDDDEVEKEEPGWKTSTHGCIQMRNPDVAEFSKLVGVGDLVTILDRPLNPPPAKPQLPEGLR